MTRKVDYEAESRWQNRVFGEYSNCVLLTLLPNGRRVAAYIQLLVDEAAMENKKEIEVIMKKVHEQPVSLVAIFQSLPAEKQDKFIDDFGFYKRIPVNKDEWLLVNEFLDIPVIARLDSQE